MMLRSLPALGRVGRPALTCVRHKSTVPVQQVDRVLPPRPAVQPLGPAPLPSDNKHTRPAGPASSGIDFEADDLDPTALRSSRRLAVRLELARVAKNEPQLLQDLGVRHEPLPMVPRITPHTTTEAMLQALEKIVGLPLPPALAAQAITHESWKYGTSFAGHNRRLSFVGRKVLKMLTSTFLHAHLPPGSDPASLRAREEVSQLLFEPNKSLSSTWFHITDANQPRAGAAAPPPSRPYDVLLNTLHLGGSVGEHLHLEEVLRWSPKYLTGRLRDLVRETYPAVEAYEAQVRKQGSKDGIALPTGPFLPGWAFRPATIGEARKTFFWRIRGVAVEALMGAVYHHHGLGAAQTLFHAKYLPGLVARGNMRTEGSRQEYNHLPLDQYPVRWPRAAGAWDDVAQAVEMNTPAALVQLAELSERAYASSGRSAGALAP